MEARGRMAPRALELRATRGKVRAPNLPRAVRETRLASLGQQGRRHFSGPGSPPLICTLPPRRR
eukprot:14667026-Alexandrium_andersonii.AAC.1